MKNRPARTLLVLIIVLLSGSAVFADENPEIFDLPFRVDLEGFSIPDILGLHSFAMAGTAEELIILAGRTNGLHAFPASSEAGHKPAFPSQRANTTVYLVDLIQRRLLGKASVDGLKFTSANGQVVDYSLQFRSSNTQYLHDKSGGDWLYIVGGYGADSPGGANITLPYVTVIDFRALVGAVRTEKLDSDFARQHIARTVDPKLAITGGELEKLGDQFLLIYGHRFDGDYVVGSGGSSQSYSNQVRVFDFSPRRQQNGLELTSTYLGSVPEILTGMSPENPYHRRDLPISPATHPTSGRRVITAYGGVFKGGRMEGYVHPIYISDGARTGGKCISGENDVKNIHVCEDTSACQLLSQYDGARLQLYDQANRTMYSTFFGGISGFYWDQATRTLKQDVPQGSFRPGRDGLPFIDDVSTLVVRPRGNGTDSRQYVHLDAYFPPRGAESSCPDPKPGNANHRRMAPYGGTESRFVPAVRIDDRLAEVEEEILRLDRFASGEKTLIGYSIGGIASTAPYGSRDAEMTCPSNQMYAVYLTRGAPTQAVELHGPSGVCEP